MNIVGERILIFSDSLSHHGSDGAVEIWNVDAGSNRPSSAPGDLLASMLAEQGAQAVRIDANVGRSAHNFWAGNAKRQLHSAQELIASDQVWGPTKVIVMLGTNDADSGAIDAAAMAAIRDVYAGMGAEVWAVGPPIFVSDTLNAKADRAFQMMSEVFGDKLIDARPLSSVIGRAGDGVHFQTASAQQFALQLANALATTNSSVWNRKPWLGAALGVAIFGTLGYLIFDHFQRGQLGEHEDAEDAEDDDDDDEGDELQGEKLPAYFVNPDDGEVIEVDQQTAVFRPKRNDRLPGGKAAGRPDSNFDPKALARGLKVELEHTSDREIAKEIAKDHLTEDPAYYAKLAKVHLDGTFADVRTRLKRLGVDEMISERDNEIHVGKIVVPKGSRGAGTGTRAMQLLTDYADQTGKRIVLTPSKDFGASSVTRLKTFYKRFGFVENKGRNKDWTTRETMIRTPRP